MQNLKKVKAFTLIELLVVIAIIGLLASIVAVQVNKARVKARDVRRKADLKTIQTAMEMYYDEKNTYKIENVGWNNSGEGYFNKGDGVDPYIKSIAKGLEEANVLSKAPIDPSGGIDSGYFYALDLCTNEGEGGYFVYARLEAPSAEDLATYPNNACSSVYYSGTGFLMNYAVGHKEQ